MLQRALRDPSLELGLPISASSTSASTVSRSSLRSRGSDRAVTKIGDEIIVHDAAAHQPELDEAIDAARLALEQGLSLRSLEATARREIALLDAIPDNVYRTSADGVARGARQGHRRGRKFAAGMVGRGSTRSSRTRSRSSSWTAFGARSTQVSP